MRTPRSAPPSIEVDPSLGEHLHTGDGPSPDAGEHLGAAAPPAAPPSSGARGLWFAAAVLWSRRWLLIGVGLVTALAAVAFSLMLPQWYSAETRVMLPGKGGGGMSAIIESIAPGAGSLLGGGSGGDYTRYLAILTSRTVMERVVERFDLVDRYETADEPGPTVEAIKELMANTTFEVSLEYNYLGIHVLDQDPRVAAAMANFFVEELNRENTRLSSESAREQRQFVERRLREAELALDSVRADLQALQERYGVTEPSVQGEAVMAALGAATAAVAEADVMYQSLRSELGDENPQVAAARSALSTARQQLNSLQSGGSALLPVPLRQLPQVGREYGRLQQEMLIQAEIIKFVRPMYEQAAFDERSEMSAVQVIDPAVPPVRKAKPKRSYIVLGITASTVLLLGMALVALALFRRSAPHVMARLRQHAPER